MWITILTPLYNGIEFLEETIDSVLQQTEKEWQMVIGVNGHGGHGAMGGRVAEKARELTKKDGRIKVVVQGEHINNKSKSLNDLVKNHVKTEWVAILDADDIWLPTKLEEQKKLCPAGYGVIGTMGEYFGKTTGKIRIKTESISRTDILVCNHILNSSAILQTKYAVWNENDYIQGIEDYNLWLHLIIVQKIPVYNISTLLFRHRLHPDSAFNTKSTIHKVKQLVNIYKLLR